MADQTVDRRRVALFAYAHGVDDIYQGAVPALLPFFVADRHYNYAGALGLTFAMTAMSSVIQPVFGVLTDRRDLFWLAPAGLSLAGVGVGLSGLAGNYLLTWLAIALSGIGIAAFHPEAARSARRAAAKSQRAMSVFAVGGNVGFAIGPLFTGAVIAATGLRGTTLLTLPAIATGVGVFVVLARRPTGRRAPTRAERAAARADDDVRGFVVLTSVVVVRSILFFGLSSLLALYVGTTLHGGRQLGELALTTLLASGAIGTICGGWLADRHGRVLVTRVTLALATFAVLAVVVAPLALVFPAIALAGFTLFQSFSLTVTLGQDYLPSRVGTSSGVTLGLAISVGGFFAPVLGLLADTSGLRVALAVLLVLPPTAAALASRLREPDHGASPGRARHGIQPLPVRAD